MKISIVFLIIVLSLIFVSATPYYFRPMSGGSVQPGVSFNYEVNYTTDSAGTNVVLGSGRQAVTLDSTGVGFVELNTSSVSGVPLYVIEVKDGTIRKVFNLSDQFFRDVYARNLNLSGNLTIDWGFFTSLNVSSSMNISNISVDNIHSLSGLGIVIWDNTRLGVYNLTTGSNLSIGDGSMEDPTLSFVSSGGDIGTIRYEETGNTFHVNHGIYIEGANGFLDVNTKLLVGDYAKFDDSVNISGTLFLDTMTNLSGGNINVLSNMDFGSNRIFAGRVNTSILNVDHIRNLTGGDINIYGQAMIDNLAVIANFSVLGNAGFANHIVVYGNATINQNISANTGLFKYLNVTGVAYLGSNILETKWINTSYINATILNATSIVQAEHFYSTDDAKIADDLITGGKIEVSTTGEAAQFNLITATDHATIIRFISSGITKGMISYYPFDDALKISHNDSGVTTETNHLIIKNGSVGIQKDPLVELDVGGDIGATGVITAVGAITGSNIDQDVSNGANPIFGNVIMTSLDLNAGSLLIPIKGTTGDPAALEGKLYANTFDNKLRIYIDGAWRDIITW